MKARRNAATPTKVSPTHERGLEISQITKKQKVQIAPYSLLKTKGQRKCSLLVYENKGVIMKSLLVYENKGDRSIFGVRGSRKDLSNSLYPNKWQRMSRLPIGGFHRKSPSPQTGFDVFR